ncbi:hypothetical protein B566_EDAN006348 [Ephemera danica]|nr:hypothetical protein B566_EDAN006348 [Ephemera danica]
MKRLQSASQLRGIYKSLPDVRGEQLPVKSYEKRDTDVVMSPGPKKQGTSSSSQDSSVTSTQLPAAATSAASSTSTAPITAVVVSSSASTSAIQTQPVQQQQPPVRRVVTVIPNKEFRKKWITISNRPQVGHVCDVGCLRVCYQAQIESIGLLSEIIEKHCTCWLREELVASTPNQRNWRGILIALLVIMAVLGLIVFSIVLLSPPDEGPRVKGRKLQREDVTSALLHAPRFNGSWVNVMKA